MDYSAAGAVPAPAFSPDEYQQKIRQVFAEVGKVVVGQHYMINRLLIGLFTGGHILLEGVPGLAKTLTISTLSKVLHLHFQRVQFTPDLLPSDLVGTMIYNQNQSVEQEGTYPLPEAQVDRFMMKVYVDYLKKADELEVMRRMANMSYVSEVNPILTRDDIFGVRSLINQVQISETLEKYIIELVFATRKPGDYDLAEFAQYVQFGVSPRASIALHRAAKAVAFFDQRDYVLPEDIKEVAGDVLNHRILLNYEAEADGIRTQDLIEAILRKVPIS